MHPVADREQELPRGPHHLHVATGDGAQAEELLPDDPEEELLDEELLLPLTTTLILPTPALASTLVLTSKAGLAVKV